LNILSNKTIRLLADKALFKNCKIQLIAV
jgi:hypothetical protein